MSYQTKNYTEAGGERTVINGELEINGKMIAGEGAEFEGITPTCENQEESSATTIAGLKEDFNALLAKMKAAGLMAADTEPDPDPDPESDTDPQTSGEG